ncbi:serine carboxypeptidase-like 2 [Gossypium australe]|uniref:Serine carboxypeptidase-like 2 n=1 Tax=Gossypium australe TaxID=47621 RepID=A0A5B6URI8_9ROSI|nr:serine carboxypeptidase-like 2 [Gossypium australe]
MVCSFYLLHDNYSGFETGGKLFANDGYNFARKVKPTVTCQYLSHMHRVWLQSHPKFITNSLYIAGDSYAGIKEDYVPASNLKSAKRNCKEEYVEVDMSNVKCAKDLEVITKCIAYVNKPHILEPRCPSDFNPSDILVNKRKYF